MGEDLLEAFAELESTASRCRKVLSEDAWRLSEPELVALTRRQHDLDAQVQTIGLVLVQQTDARGVATAAGATSTQAWLTQTLRITPHLAKHRVTLARGLKERYPDTGAALAESHIGVEQAAAILAVVDGLPSKASAQDKAGAERFLLERASELHAGDLRRLGKRIDAVIDPDGTLGREEAAKERRGLSFRDHHDGTQTLAWRDTDENIATVKAAMSALSAPAPAADGSQDPRTPTLRRAGAMLEIVTQAMRKGRLPRARGERPHLVITADITALRTGHGFAVTGSGESISAAVRRLACDADVFAVAMTRWRAPLEMGRRKRTVTPTQWVALCARDTGCVFPGCTRPADFCIAHHIVHWAEGGPTNLDNLALLCGHHHDAVHHKGWDIYLAPDRHPRLRPPAWIDPERPETQNTYWKTQQAMADALRAGQHVEPN